MIDKIEWSDIVGGVRGRLGQFTFNCYLSIDDEEDWQEPDYWVVDVYYGSWPDKNALGTHLGSGRVANKTEAIAQAPLIAAQHLEAWANHMRKIAGSK